ncbi:uncharacterized protein JCM15063_002363 [Sporobolomyces koalae]|uniref:uncharacterized protein n=1 Tax=Sporobolomyces koalae TaxID=500713 RepID=UPI00317A07FF
MEVEPALAGGHDYEDSSSDSHSSSSPSASDSAYSASSQPEWALDLGLSIPTLLGGSPWGSHPAPLKLAPVFASSTSSAAMHAPSAASLWQGYQDTPVDQQTAIAPAAYERDDASVRDDHHPRRNLAMDFDDMINEDVCGPSTLNSTVSSPQPAQDHHHEPSRSLSYSHISMPALSASTPGQPHSYLASAGLALQLPTTAAYPPVAGIAPALTGGQPTPPLGSPLTNPLPQIPVSPEPVSGSDKSELVSVASSALQDLPVAPSRPPRERRTSSRAAGMTRSANASASSSRERVPGCQHSGLSSNTPLVPGTGVNLVSREAIQVTQLIPHQANPATSAITASTSTMSSAFAPSVKLLVLGVPTHGAKSRVETQIKISLSLVRPFGGIKREGLAPDWAEDLVNEEGSIDPTIAAEQLERVGSWSHIRLPKYLALKSKIKDDAKTSVGKKTAVPGPPPAPEDTLVLDVAVVRASDPSSQIFICTNCRARELKRSLRKKDPKNKGAPAPAPLVEDAVDKDEEEEKRKVVVFNSPEYVEFGTGECVLPTRVTCYCRHHKEKKGFCVTYSLRDHLDNIVASGMTPPILITDDHKTSVAKHAQVAATAASISMSAAASSVADAKRKAPAKTASTALTITNSSKKERVPAAISTSARSRRAGGRSRRGASDSGDAAGEDEAELSSKKAKPYDAEGRPKKRHSPASRHSPAFAMTPLHSGQHAEDQRSFSQSHSAQTSASTSRATSPGSGPLTRGASPTSQHPALNFFASALGLDGIGSTGDDAIMTDSAASVASPTFVPPASFSPRHSISTECSVAPQHQAHNLFDWRPNTAGSTISTPPLSPGATTPSVHNESLNSLFSSFPTSIDSTQAFASPLPPPVSSIPSFAIPATEPLQSLTSTWAFQQALQQQQQEIAASLPPPRINRLIPGEGPVSGGIEVTILGENFVRDLTCLFGDSGAVSTHFWSTNTLVCILPPSANPGPVFVGIKGVLHNPEQGGLPLFTYKDNSDRNLLELALQVVGLKMTGRLEDASAVAMRIVGNSPQGGAGSGTQRMGGAQAGMQDTAALAATLNAAAASAYATPASSRPSSRRPSFTETSATSSTSVAATGEARNFEGIVIKFLSLLDLDASLLPGAAPSVPSATPPISQPDAQQHTLLHLATVLGFHRLASFLLARGIDCDAADRNGYTALHFAALYGRVTITRQLLEAGADSTLETYAGKSAIEIARERDDVDVEDLLNRFAPSPVPTHDQITPRFVARRPLVASSPISLPQAIHSGDESGRLSYVDDEQSWTDDSRSDESTGGDDSHDYPSAEDDSERSWSESSDWSADSDDDHGDTEGELHEPRLKSRNASVISLHYLLAAEDEARCERASASTSDLLLSGEYFGTSGLARLHRVLPVVITAESDLAQASPPVAFSPKVSPSSWLSKKLKPTVQPGLNKLQPLAGGVTNAWSKARANRFALPHMHMPELGTFPAMPAAITRRMSSTRQRTSRATSAGEETDAGEESGWEGASRHWRALYSGQWWHKTPPSPPPQYTPSDSLYLPNTTDPDHKAALESPAATRTTLSARSSATRRLSKRSRRILSDASDDVHGSATNFSSEFETGKYEGNDRMLWFFWIPVLIFVLTFAYLNFQVYLTPVLETLADTILPDPLAKLLA